MSRFLRRFSSLKSTSSRISGNASRAKTTSIYTGQLDVLQNDIRQLINTDGNTTIINECQVCQKLRTLTHIKVIEINADVHQFNLSPILTMRQLIKIQQFLLIQKTELTNFYFNFTSAYCHKCYQLLCCVND